jgi:hypothetical protein
VFFEANDRRVTPLRHDFYTILIIFYSVPLDAPSYIYRRLNYCQSSNVNESDKREKKPAPTF